MTKKVVITGHASGLGQALANRFAQDDFEIIGWDIALNSDHNLALDSVMDQVVDSCQDADYFINNAQVRQEEYLLRVHDSWLEQPRMIISVGTCLTYYWTRDQARERFPWLAGFDPYYSKKQHLDQVHRELLQQHHDHRILGPTLCMVRPSFMNTDNHEDVSLPKLSVEHVAGMIFEGIAYRGKLAVTDMVITPY